MSYLAVGIVLNITTGGLSYTAELRSRINDIDFDNRKNLRTNLYKYYFHNDIEPLTIPNNKFDEIRFKFVIATVRLNDKDAYEVQLIDHENNYGKSATYKFPKKLLNREEKYGEYNLTEKSSVMLTLQDAAIERNSTTVVILSDFNYWHNFFQAQYNEYSQKQIDKANQLIYDELSKIEHNDKFILIHNLVELTPQVDLVNIKNNKVYSASQYKIDIPENIKAINKQNTKTVSTELSVLDYSGAFALDALTYPFQWELIAYIILCSFQNCE